jgi:hypothetical protein
MNERSSLIRSVLPRSRKAKSTPPPQSSWSFNDLLVDDDDGHDKYSGNTTNYNQRQSTNVNHPFSNANGMEDVDLIQMNDEENLRKEEQLVLKQSNPFSPSSTVSKLQQRMHGRQHLHLQSIVMDDEDGGDSDMEEESRLLDLSSLEMETIRSTRSSSDPFNTNVTPSNIPLHDLTSIPMQKYSGTMDPSNLVPQNTYRNGTRTTDNAQTMTASDKQTNCTNDIERTPPRITMENNYNTSNDMGKIKYTPTRGGTSNVIVTHAKRAVSTLFGSSVVVQNQCPNIDPLGTKIHASSISLLDTIDSQDNHIQLPSIDTHSMKQRHGPTDYNRLSSSSNMAKSWFGERNTRTQTIPSANSTPFVHSDQSRFHHDTRDVTSMESIPSSSLPSSSSSSSSWTHVPPPSTTRTFLHERVFKGRLASSYWCDGFLKDVNWLNLGLCISYGLSTAAATVPITLIPTIAMDILQKNAMVGDDGNNADNINIDALISVFASKVTMYAVLGTAFGKFVNGPLGDILGARRVACFYALLVSISLMVLSFSSGEWSVIYCCVAVEYYQSVQWPCAAIMLAAHYGKDDMDSSDKKSSTSSEKGHGVQYMPEHVVGDYEKGIYIVSMGSRIGSLLASISVTMLLRYQNDSWRFVARLASMVRKIIRDRPTSFISRFC